MTKKKRKTIRKKKEVVPTNNIALTIELHKSLANIMQILNIFKDMFNVLIESAQKQGTDLELTNQKMDFMNEAMKKIESISTEIKSKLSSLVVQLDFKEISAVRKEVEKKKEKNKKRTLSIDLDKLWVGVITVLKNAKWIAVILFCILIFLAIKGGVITGNELWEYIKGLKWWPF